MLLLATTFALIASGCSEGSRPFEPVAAAPPQSADVGWTESFPEAGPALVFRVGTVRIRPDRWEADISIENETKQPYEIPSAASAKRLFGVMIFGNDDLDELESRSKAGELPTVRSAQSTHPELPAVLAPGERWTGTIASAGSLPAGQWMRVVFGPLAVRGEVPNGSSPRSSGSPTTPTGSPACRLASRHRSFCRDPQCRRWREEDRLIVQDDAAYARRSANSRSSIGSIPRPSAKMR